MLRTNKNLLKIIIIIIIIIIIKKDFFILANHVTNSLKLYVLSSNYKL